MAGEETQRRLAAILAADVVGYSRLISEDEDATLNTFRLHLTEFIEPTITEFNGRLFKTMGDGLLAEFASVVEAVQCAVTIQKGVASRNDGIPQAPKLEFRIGINLGDVVVQDGDVFGDGVNVAARLEGLAAPGQICISRSARDQIRDKLDYGLEDWGEIDVKNIPRPVRVFRILSDPQDAGKNVAKRALGGMKSRPVLAVMAVLLLLIATGLLAAVTSGWIGMTASNSDVPPSLDPPRLSIAVLPFKNLSSNPDQDYFADALTEDLTADLSRISGSFVISRRTAAMFRGKDIDAKSIAEELKVRYLLEGTVRRQKSDIRVNVQLTDGQTGQEIWADRYERNAEDVHDFHAAVTGQVARALNLELKEAVGRQATRKGSENLDSKDLALRAWAEVWNKPQTPETNRTGLEFARRALELDPNNAEALGVATYAYARAANYGWGMSRAEGIASGINAGERSLSLDPNNADTVYALGFIYYVAGETNKALELMRYCIELNRNHAPAYFFSGVSLIRLGKPREAILWVDRAFALSPRDPLRSVWYAVVGRAQIILGEDAMAVETAHKGVTANRKHLHNHAVLASAYAHLGQMKKAKASLEVLKKLMPNITVSRYQHMAASTDPVAIKSYRRLMVGLQKAGLPEK